jgi:hypothetical protein
MTSPIVFPGPLFRMTRVALYRTAAIVWGMALLVGSLQPHRPGHMHAGVVHHIVHVSCFGALAVLVALGFSNPRRPARWPASVAFLFGFGIEFLQHWKNRMPIEWYDVRDDAAGILVFSALLYIACRLPAGPASALRLDDWEGNAGTPVKILRTLWAYLQFARLSLLGRFSKSKVVNPGGPVVSLTSYGPRINGVHVVIESIARGRLLPSALILWLDDEKLFHDLPKPLKRLERRGLEVRLTRNHGPHKKYFPYVQVQTVFRLPLVTADDDVFYPRDWLERLVQAFRERPDVVNCYRARVVAWNGDGLSRYEEWALCESTQPSFRHFATGVSGVIYPPELLAALKNAGRAFEECCPKADDIWLHAQALRAGFKVRQIVSKARHFPILPGTQKQSLQLSNVSGPDAGNDRQMLLTYSQNDLKRLRDASAVGEYSAGVTS